MDLPRPRLLVLRAIGLGDLLAGVPALRALRRALPEHELTLAAPGVQAPLVHLLEAVDRHLPTEELAPIRWTGRAPEVAVDLHGNGPASRQLLEHLHPGLLVGFSSYRRRWPGAVTCRWDPQEHERVRWCRLVHEAFDEQGDPDDVLLPAPATPNPRPGVVVVHPGAASNARRWPAERFADVARLLHSSGHDVVLTGSRGERGLAEDVRRLAGLSPDAVLAGRTDLGELAAVVAGAELVLSGDTGTSHLASAFGRPSVTLFGPTPPERWGPPQRPQHRVLWHGERVGDPHALSPDPALMRIGVEEVLDACQQLLGDQQRRASGHRGHERRPAGDPGGDPGDDPGAHPGAGPGTRSPEAGAQAPRAQGDDLSGRSPSPAARSDAGSDGRGLTG